MKEGCGGIAAIFLGFLGSLEPLTESLEGRDAEEGVSVLFLEAFFLLLALLEILAASLGEGVGGMICGEGQVSAAGPENESACPLSHQVIFPWTGPWDMPSNSV